ncbi:hypothetical protein [Allobaculum sp. Allo2]|uniref:hypothetical protein n=1 Tax=Allobaculum sp. Allo2 TaxID=2853432 RepID=UPI001F601C1B|nr:hypothetical protein [Allobaculum sp. Allo2]UNT93483.1 hypothetical protein KWG61_01310 [Allobaculum sp. Allo2]
MPSPERARRFLYGFYMDMDPEKTLDPGMRAIFFLFNLIRSAAKTGSGLEESGF